MPKGSGKVPIVIWAHASGGAGNMNTSAACDTGSASVGLYGAAPDVTVSFE